MTRRLLVPVLAALLSACSSGGSEGGGAPFDVPGEPVATNAVELPKSYKFEPVVISVDAGTEVTWTNSDNFPHNVHVVAGAPEETVDLPIGETGTLTFDEPGTVFYECSIHPQQMKGRIEVA